MDGGSGAITGGFSLRRPLEADQSGYAPEPDRHRDGEGRSTILDSRLRPGPGHSREEVAANQRARLRAAMIELVAAEGFESVTIRRLYRTAGVSSETFYRHFDNAEDCFAATYAQITERVLRRARIARDSAPDWEASLRAALRSILLEAAEQPKAAATALLGAYTAGPGMLLRVRTAASDFEGFFAETLRSAPPGARVDPQLVPGIGAGVIRVIRARLLSGCAAELPACADPLADWVLALCDQRSAELAQLGDALVARPELWRTGPAASMGWLDSRDEERVRLLAAVVKLATEHGYWRLTPAMIRAEARVSRAAFDARYAGVGECFAAAASALVTGAAAHAEREALRAESWERGVYRGTFSLCAEIARNPDLAQLGFADLFAPGGEGLRCCAGLVSLGVRRLRENAPSARRPSELAAEASMAAGWQLAYRQVIDRQMSLLPRLVPAIAYLALAPACGAESALRAIRAEQQHLVGLLPSTAHCPSRSRRRG